MSGSLPRKRKPRLSLAQWCLIQELREGALTIGGSTLATAQALGRLGLVYELEAGVQNFGKGKVWRARVALTGDGKHTATTGLLPERLLPLQTVGRT